MRNPDLTEECVQCGELTGRAGRADDSLYIDDAGPFCSECFEAQRAPVGTPLSRLSGRPGHPGYSEFKRIAASWGYE